MSTKIGKSRKSGKKSIGKTPSISYAPPQATSGDVNAEIGQNSNETITSEHVQEPTTEQVHPMETRAREQIRLNSDEVVNQTLNQEWQKDHDPNSTCCNGFFKNLFNIAPQSIDNPLNEQLDEAAKQVDEYFNQDDIGQSYNTLTTDELEAHLQEKSDSTRQFSDIEHSVAAVKSYDKDTGLFRITWKDSLEYSSSLSTLDWCFIFASMKSNHCPIEQITDAYNDWKGAREASGIDKYRGFNYQYPRSPIAGFWESIRRLKHVDTRAIPQNAIQTLKNYQQMRKQKLQGLIVWSQTHQLDRTQRRNIQLYNTINQIVKAIEDDMPAVDIEHQDHNQILRSTLI